MKQAVVAKKEEEEISTFNRVHEFIFGPTPVPPQVRMDEIEKRTRDLRKTIERDHDDKTWEVEQVQKRLNAAALKGDESVVRQHAITFVEADKQRRMAGARLKKVDTAMNRMSEIRVSGETDKNLIDFMQCSNELLAKSTNPAAVKNTTARFLAQKQARSLCKEMVDDAMESSEDEEANDETNEAVEALVQRSMETSAMNLLSKMPTIIVNSPNNNNKNKNPANTASQIQQYLDKK